MRYVGLHDGRHNQLKWCRSGNEWKHMTLVASNTSRPHLAPGPFRAFSSSHPGCGKLNTTASILAKSTGVRSHLVGVSSSSRGGVNVGDDRRAEPPELRDIRAALGVLSLDELLGIGPLYTLVHSAQPRPVSSPNVPPPHRHRQVPTRHNPTERTPSRCPRQAEKGTSVSHCSLPGS